MVRGRNKTLHVNHLVYSGATLGCKKMKIWRRYAGGCAPIPAPILIHIWVFLHSKQNSIMSYLDFEFCVAKEKGFKG